jgi:hypothetical protein
MGQGSAGRTSRLSHLAGTMVAVRDHLIWCPKYRRRVLAGGVDGRLKVIIGGTQNPVILQHAKLCTTRSSRWTQATTRLWQQCWHSLHRRDRRRDSGQSTPAVFRAP